MPSIRRPREPVSLPQTLEEPVRLSKARVGKTMAPGAPGTLKLQRRFGPDLLAVRYRYDWTGLVRYTTVELVVARAPLQRAARENKLYALRIERHERSLQHSVATHGGQWDAELRRWILPAATVQDLDLAHRVELVESEPHRPASAPSPRRPKRQTSQP